MSDWGGRKVEKLRALVIATYGNQCWRCRLLIDLGLSRMKPGGLMVGHVVPRSKGGTDDISNLRPEHRRCGLSAGNRTNEQNARRPARRNSRFFSLDTQGSPAPVHLYTGHQKNPAEYGKGKQ